MTDHDFAIRAILLRPWDDTPRLIYADWLEKHADEGMTCNYADCDGTGWITDFLSASGRVLQCPTCNGTGRIPNGYAERAEFIRVQVELAKCPVEVRADRRFHDHRYYKPEPWGGLLLRERELWRAIEPWSFVSDMPKDWTLTTLAHGTEFRVGPHEGHPLDIRCVVQKGFISIVYAPLASLLEHLPAIVREHPVERVEVTDREPMNDGDEATESNWVTWLTHEDDLVVSADERRIPRIIAELMPRETRGGEYRWSYSTLRSARASLSAALLHLSREKAGVPHPEPRNQEARS